MKSVEVLAPVGNMDAFYAAIEGGADAIYLAGKLFGARAYADNFNEEELIKIIETSHLYGIKVYVTCNTLVLEREVNNFINYIEFLHKNNVDAIIMQDLGMIDLVRKTFPNLEIHASTQAHIHNLEGAKVMESLGVKRVVLARETPLEIVKKIKEETGLEVEVFVHGALCASYSGMCLFARSIGPRSGNRGTCSGCCRLPYNLQDENGKILNSDKYPLSMKDLNTLEYLDKLIEIGVDSLKIEGRMKSYSYVYLTTKLYKDTLNNYLKTKEIKVNSNDLWKLENVFNREFTKGFMLGAKSNEVTNPISPNHKGVLIGKVIKSNNSYITIKLNNDISIHDGLRIKNKDFEYGLVLNLFKVNDKQVYKAKNGEDITIKVNKKIPINSKVFRTLSYEIESEIKDIIKNKLRKVKIDLEIKIKSNKNIVLKVSDKVNTIEVFGNIPSPSLKHEITIENIKEKILKLGNTIYQVDNLKIDLDNNLFVPISEINNLKRDALNLLDKKRIYQNKYIKKEYSILVPDFEKVSEYTILTDKDIKNSKYKYIYNDNNIIKLPKVMDSYNNLDKNKEYLIGEIGGLSLKNIVSDYSLNVTNSYTVAFLHSIGVKRVTLSLELNDKEIEDLINSYKNRYKKNPNLELIVKTNMELMVLKLNFKDIYNNPKYLVDRFNNKYYLVYKNNLMYIYDYKNFVLENPSEYFKLGINYLRWEDIIL